MIELIWKGPTGDVPGLGRCWPGREITVPDERADELIAQKLAKQAPEPRGDTTKKRSKGD